MGWLSTEHLLETQADADGRCEAPPQFGERAPPPTRCRRSRRSRRWSGWCGACRALPVLYMCAPHMKRCDGLYANATRVRRPRPRRLARWRRRAAQRHVESRRASECGRPLHHRRGRAGAPRRRARRGRGSPAHAAATAAISRPELGEARRAVALPLYGWQSCARGSTNSICACAAAALSTTATPASCGAQPHAAATSFHATKHGWMSTTVGDEVAFDVGGDANFGAMLCRTPGRRRADRDRYQRERRRRPRRCLDLCWQSRSSQQCLVSAGTVGPGRHTLTIRVMKAATAAAAARMDRSPPAR